MIFNCVVFAQVRVLLFSVSLTITRYGRISPRPLKSIVLCSWVIDPFNMSVIINLCHFYCFTYQTICIFLLSKTRHFNHQYANGKMIGANRMIVLREIYFQFIHLNIVFFSLIMKRSILSFSLLIVYIIFSIQILLMYLCIHCFVSPWFDDITISDLVRFLTVLIIICNYMFSRI